MWVGDIGAGWVHQDLRDEIGMGTRRKEENPGLVSPRTNAGHLGTTWTPFSVQ